MKRFLNSRETLVDQAIDGFLASSAGSGLARLDSGPGARVVLRADADIRANPGRAEVAIVSGGGSGHEPAHAGFVGPGMLSAAVCGDIFASPPVDAVLSAILAVTGSAGCLLVIKNYTGDRLNFGLAAERARGLGLAVETVIVGDDIALPGQANPRGLAGTLFVHRIAGLMAEQGRPLAEIAEAARAVAADTASIGLSLSDVDAYSGRSEDSSRLGPDQVELGLGIHGEPGAETLAMADADALMARASDRLQRALPDKTSGLALLLNNLGRVPPIEMSLLLDAFRRTPLAQRVELVIGPAPLMTSLDMNGFSLSVLTLTHDRREALTTPCRVAAWPGACPLAAPRTVPAPTLPDAVPPRASEDAGRRALILRGVRLLQEFEAPINAIDARIGDGDTGSTFAQAGRTVAAAIDRLPLADDAALFAAFGQILSQSAGGSSGVLLSILFTAAAQAQQREPGPAAALRAGLERMKAHGGAQAGDRTMIDALEPALDALAAGGTPSQAAGAARAGADATRSMAAGAGRARYVPGDALRDVPDPGAEAIARLFEGLA
ncbi:dihydroxyacetone kinase subunit DhaK [Lichenicola sp.]|uniref:dihydroxyacetone kinase subunit DhaK n=1 Tax=Lichenicola sp. TaxID=2804529 RepID=UPI003AFFF7C5